MPTTCVVVDCNNRHSAGCNVSFYRFPDPVQDIERRRRWINFVSRKNEDGTPCEPAKGSRLCSKHFISGEKSDSPTSPDFVPSIYPKTAEKKPANSNAVENLARHERAQRRSVSNEQAHMAKEKEKESTCKSIRQALKAFEHDHGSYCKAREQQSSKTVEQMVDFNPVRRDTTVSQFPNIPAEVGKLNLANDDVAL